MPRWKPKRCKVEGCPATPEQISNNGYCLEHGLERKREADRQMAEGRGEFYEHWVYRSALAARRQLVALERTKG